MESHSNAFFFRDFAIFQGEAIHNIAGLLELKAGLLNFFFFFGILKTTIAKTEKTPFRNSISMTRKSTDPLYSRKQFQP